MEDQSNCPVNLPLSGQAITLRVKPSLLPHILLILIHQLHVLVTRTTPAFDAVQKDYTLHSRVFLVLDIIIEPTRRTGASSPR